MSRVRASEQQSKGKQIAQGTPAKVNGSRTCIVAESGNKGKVSGYGSRSMKSK